MIAHLLLCVESHQVDLARRQTLLDEEVAHLGLFNYEDGFLNPGDLFSGEHRLGIIIKFWLFVVCKFVFDASVVESQGLKLVFEVASHVYNKNFGLLGIHVMNHSRYSVSFQQTLNYDAVFWKVEQLI